MKTGCLFFRVAALLVPAALLCAGKVLGAAQPASGSPAESAGVSNAVPAGAAIPLSVFLMPATREEGKDPFYPRSVYPYGSAPVKPSTNVTVQVVVDLKFNGFSGTAEHRLAIINGRTFDQGEEAEVRSGAGRVRVKVVEIKTDYVIVEAAGQRQVLRLRTGL
jgi:hypothetical protein